MGRRPPAAAKCCGVEQRQSNPSTRLSFEDCLAAPYDVWKSSHCQTLKKANDFRETHLQKLGATRHLGLCICDNGSTPHPINLPRLMCRSAGFCATASPSRHDWRPRRAAAKAGNASDGGSRGNSSSSGQADYSVIDEFESRINETRFVDHADDARIVTVLANRRSEQVKHILHVKQGLRYVRSALSFHVLLCGVRDPEIEALFLEANISYHPMESPAVPIWAHKNHRTTFSKLLVWNASYA